MNQQISFFDEDAEYQAFVDKFKPKKTTDDCYTPPEIYDVVKEWACKEYGIDPGKIVRPFYPGGDYERYCYPNGAVVLDNPPFSILNKICEFYLAKGIPFFLFAPSLTILSGRKIFQQMNHIVCNAEIVYENGAAVLTGFVTSYGGDVVAQTAPELGEKINQTSKQIKHTKTMPKYRYPDHVLTAAMLQKYSKYGISLKIRRDDCAQVGYIDSQKNMGKTIFGSGLLLSEKAAAEKAAAEKAAAKIIDENTIEWTLSLREREIINSLGNKRRETHGDDIDHGDCGAGHGGGGADLPGRAGRRQAHGKGRGDQNKSLAEEKNAHE